MPRLPFIAGAKHRDLGFTLKSVWRTFFLKVAHKEIQRLAFAQFRRDALVKTLCLAEFVGADKSGAVQFQLLSAQFQRSGVVQFPKNKGFREISHILGRCPRVITGQHSAVVIEIADEFVAADQQKSQTYSFVGIGTPSQLRTKHEAIALLGFPIVFHGFRAQPKRQLRGACGEGLLKTWLFSRLGLGGPHGTKQGDGTPCHPAK